MVAIVASSLSVPAAVDATPVAGAMAGIPVVAANGIGQAVTFVGGRAPLTPPADLPPEEVAEAFVERHGPSFGAADDSELVATDATDTLDGGHAVRFQQRVDGVPVLGGEIVVKVDENGRVRSSAGEVVPDGRIDPAAAPAIDTTPIVAAATAATTAIAVTARIEGVSVEVLRADAPTLWIYDPALIGAPVPATALGGTPTRLVWRTEVRNALGDIDRFVLIDALDGTVVLEFSQVHAVDSQVCDNANVARTSHAQAQCPSATQTVARSDATGPSAVTEVERTYQLSEAVIAFYAGLGRHSIDDNGMAVRTTVRFCLGSCPFANAYWDGQQMVYGTGYATADDVVAHELTHGVTQYESGLLYYSDSGAINESLSDVFGELFDLGFDSSWDDDRPSVAWLLGEDLPGGAIRNMADPTTNGDPDRMTSPFYWGSPGDHYGVHINNGVNNKAAYLIAVGGTFNGRTMTGLGLTKTGAIYYEAQTSLLTAGSDHLDLFHALPQACANLVGTAGIVSGDCTTVSLAVQATEMDQAPVTPGARRIADVCPAGQVQDQVLALDTMESQTGWTTASTRQDSLGRWGFTNQSSQSGSVSLFGSDPAVKITSTVTRSSAVLVPGPGTYLRFDHSFSFDTTAGSVPEYWDGGQVLLSVNGAAQADVTALGLPSVHGYNGTLSTASDNDAEGQAAFVGESPGYQRTRYDLSSLAGQQVRVQFRTVTDSVIAGVGWAIDDVVVYTCAASSATTSTTPGTPAPSTTAAIPSSTTPSAADEPFVAVDPARVLDTRGESPNAMRSLAVAPVRPGAPLRVRMTGLPGGATPASGVGAVALNVVATGAAAAGFVTVYPCGELRSVSSLNVTAGATVANAVVAPVSPDGDVCFAVSTAAHLVVDLNGWFPVGDAFHPVGPARLLDTRGPDPGSLLAVPTAQVVPSRPLEFTTAGLPGELTPPTGMRAVSLNVTVTSPRTAGFLTVYPCGAPPFVASVNFAAGQTVANAVIAPVASDGRLCIASSTATDVVVDINGWIGADAPFQPVGPARVLDTRPGQSPDAVRSTRTRQVSPSDPLEVSMLGLPGLTPASGVGAVSLNVTVADPTSSGFLTVHPCGPRPFVSSVNYAPGRSVSNAVIATLSGDGRLCIFASSPVDVVVDVNGWFPA